MAGVEAPERILCATDFSGNAAAALDAAVAFARPWKAHIVVVHVFLPPAHGGEKRPAGAAPLDPAVRADLLEKLRRFGSHAVSAGIETENVLLQGEPSGEIAREARHARAALIVMGRHSRGTPDHWFLGSVTEGVLRHAPCPVMVVKPPPRAAGQVPRRVVCALDLGETSAATMAQAAALTRTLGADLLVLHVMSDRGVPRAPGPGDTVPPAQDIMRDADVGLSGLVEGASPENRRIHRRVVTGDPYEQIVAAAREGEADLVVVGSHGDGILDCPFIGSTTLHLVRKAECDVLVVPAQVSRKAVEPVEARAAEVEEMPRRKSLGYA